MTEPDEDCGGCADCVDACLDAGSITYTIVAGDSDDDSQREPTPLT